MSTINKATALCDSKMIDEGVGTTYSYETEPGDLSTSVYIVSVDWSTFLDLGSPKHITITIEPGDKLNGD